MKYCFDEVIERRGTNCIKWDYTKEIFGKEEILPLWVADMDFSVPPQVQQELEKRIKHPVFGYSGVPDGFKESFINWMQKRHDWSVENEWIIANPGVVPAISLAINTFSEEGDKVVIQPPVYPPFFSTAEKNKRELVLNPLQETDNGYEMDFDHLKKNIDSRTKMLIFCNPHNPVGRVWRENELEELVRICAEKDVLLVSDEIWSDIIMPGFKHLPLAKVADKLAYDGVITCMAPSKTFNLAGLKASATVIPEDKYRAKFIDLAERFGMNKVNMFGGITFTSAYNYGEDWLECLVSYLDENMDFLIKFLGEKLPAIKASKSEGTYLVWLDFRGLGLTDEDLVERMVHKARVGLNPGFSFGDQGKGFLRINVGCPRPLLVEALERIEDEFKNG